MTEAKKHSEFGDRRSFNSWIATAGGLGYLPKAPGTWGSLPGVAIGMALVFWKQDLMEAGRTDLAVALVVGLNIFLHLAAAHAIDRTEKLWQTHDDKRIVIDEVAGQVLALSCAIPHWTSAVLGFLLFRLFDITKPGPIGKIDKNIKNAWGTLLDDTAAGLCALFGLVLVQFFFGTFGL